MQLWIAWVGAGACFFRWTCSVVVSRRVPHAVLSRARALRFRFVCFRDAQRRMLSNALQCVALWLLGPSFLDSAHDFSLLKCCPSVPKM